MKLKTLKKATPIEGRRHFFQIPSGVDSFSLCLISYLLLIHSRQALLSPLIPRQDHGLVSDRDRKEEEGMGLWGSLAWSNVWGLDSFSCPSFQW